MAFRHLGGSAQQALPGELLLVVRKLALASCPRAKTSPEGRIPGSQGFGMVSLRD